MGRGKQAGTREACPVRDGEHAVIGQPEVYAADVLTRPVTRPRVLVVDDEEAIRAAVSRALAADGLLIDLAENGADGLKRALAEGYDLVILDLLMPGTDGFAVLRQLLRDRPGQTVLVLSCLADVRHKVDCFDLGARDYLTKPFSLDELLARCT
jgi:two-component system OmpR family response regulator